MTDRELLELAAKAAVVDTSSAIYDEDGLHIFYKPKPLVGNDRWYWNPLTDDGDCARLEADVGINVRWYEGHVVVRSSHNNSYYAEVYFQDHNNDKRAARRYASTLLAAEIGKDMK